MSKGLLCTNRSTCTLHNRSGTCFYSPRTERLSQNVQSFPMNQPHEKKVTELPRPPSSTLCSRNNIENSKKHHPRVSSENCILEDVRIIRIRINNKEDASFGRVPSTISASTFHKRGDQQEPADSPVPINQVLNMQTSSSLECRPLLITFELVY